jgi:CheY-like chemotaxis protein
MAPALVHVIDDDPAMRDSVAFLLDTAGFDVRLYEAGTALLAPARGVGLDPEAAAMRLDDGAADREADPHPGLLGGDEGLEQPQRSSRRELTVATRRVSPDLAEIAVSDTGPGIAEVRPADPARHGP